MGEMAFAKWLDEKGQPCSSPSSVRYPAYMSVVRLRGEIHRHTASALYYGLLIHV